MKRLSLFVFGVLLFVLVSSGVFAEYDRQKVVEVMRNNVALMGKAGKAAKAANFHEAAEYLIELAQGMLEIADFTPPKGFKADWDGTNDVFLKAVYKGIGACGNEDTNALNSALKELQRLSSQGHRDHR